MALKTLTLPKRESSNNHLFRCCGITAKKCFGEKIKPKIANQAHFFQCLATIFLKFSYVADLF